MTSAVSLVWSRSDSVPRLSDSRLTIFYSKAIINKSRGFTNYTHSPSRAEQSATTTLSTQSSSDNKSGTRNSSPGQSFSLLSFVSFGSRFQHFLPRVFTELCFLFLSPASMLVPFPRCCFPPPVIVSVRLPSSSFQFE